MPGTGDDGDDGGEDDGGDEGDPEPVDNDGDSYTEDVDCDDANASIYPGAEEIWDDVDQDCDGRIDGDGSFSGSLDISAEAVREGITYTFELTCPITLTRTVGALDYLATCTPDGDDPDAMDLLGAELTLSPRVSGISGEAWEDRSVLASSNGWDTFGATTITWVSWDDLSFTMSLDTISLDMTVSGVLALEE